MGNKDRRVIKRYANRKLYDTRQSSYVTLQDVADFIREGDEVWVVDNTSGEDLTKVTLAQIIYEEEKRGGSTTRRSTLMKFIQLQRTKLVESLPKPISKLLASEPDESAQGSLEGSPLLEEEEPTKLLLLELSEALVETRSRLSALEEEIRKLKER